MGGALCTHYAHTNRDNVTLNDIAMSNSLSKASSIF